MFVYFVRFTQGFQRVYDDMPDIVLDVPLAYIMLDRFVERSSRAGFLTEKVIKNMPSRFVLENSPFFIAYSFFSQECQGSSRNKKKVTLFSTCSRYNKQYPTEIATESLIKQDILPKSVRKQK